MELIIVTPFPDLVQSPLNTSIIKRAQDKGIVDIKVIDLREYTTDKHRQVDDYPYGGGPGMILKPEPFFRVMDAIGKDSVPGQEVILLTPQGSRYDQSKAKELAGTERLIFLCGHYKGVDERVRELATQEISIGDYVLTGGELAALVIIDSVTRLQPGVISDYDSAMSDSFEAPGLDCAYYTRPEDYRGLKVPQVLLSGNHAEIKKWRTENALRRTRERRQDLIQSIQEQVD